MISATCKGGSPGVGLHHQVHSPMFLRQGCRTLLYHLPHVLRQLGRPPARVGGARDPAYSVGHPQGWMVLVTQYFRKQ